MIFFSSGFLKFKSVFFVGLTIGFLLLSYMVANALHISPSPSPLPGGMTVGIHDALVAQCGHTGQSPAFVLWGAIAGTPANSVIAVPYGTTSVDLTFWAAGQICYTNSAVPEARFYVSGLDSNGAGGTFTRLTPGQRVLDWTGSHQVLGAYRSNFSSWRFNAPGGSFTSNGVYQISADFDLANRFTTGVYGCVAPGGGVISGWSNLTDCPNVPRDAWIEVQVDPPPPPKVWDYDITASGSNGSVVRANERFSIESRIRNNGDGKGPNYRQRIYVRAGSSWRTNAANNLDIISQNDTGGTTSINNASSAKIATWSGRSGVSSASSSGTRTANYEVKSDPYHGQESCFGADVNPAKGDTSPASVDDNNDYSWDVKDPGGISGHTQDQVYVNCVTTYNERFAISSPTVVRPSAAFPGQTISFDVTVFNDGTPPGNSTAGPVGVAAGIPVNISGAVNGSVTAATDSFTIPSGLAVNGSAPVSAHQVDVVVDNNVLPGENVCIDVEVEIINGYSDADRDEDNGPRTNRFCTVVVERPYFVAENHDVWAGAVWDSRVVPCGTVQTADGEIQSVNSLNLGGDDYGAWVEYAAYAIEAVTGFGSRGSPGVDSLTFANEDALSRGFIMGSGDTSVFPPVLPGTAPPRCILDYFGELFDSGATAPNINAIFNNNNSDQTFYHSGPTLTLNTSGSGSEVHGRKTAIVDGDLYIRGQGIYYDDFVYDSSTDTVSGPSLAIVVRGNIYIDDDVEELNGLFVAQPRADGTGGFIDTCSSGLGTPIKKLSTTVCDDQLTINGAIVAERFHMRRTYGGILRDFTSVNGSPAGTRLGGAEEFIFNPMMYLHQPFFDSVTGPTGSKFPIVQIKDLPPVF